MNRLRLQWLFAAVVLALPLGCSDESTAPAGTASTVAVRAYVDADGSGSFSAGDVPLAAQSITLESGAGVQVAQATTSAEGVATFQNVAPGSYTARFGGTAPAGAVLASATQPVVVAPFRGGEPTAEFRFVFNPGEISGVLFRDNNNNNVFDPGTDTPAGGIPVQLFRGSDTTTVIATATTSATGEFSFTTLRPGTYSVRVLALPTMQIVGGSTMTVTVAAATPTETAVRFTGNVLSTIATVRAQPQNDTVAFEGVATVGLGIFSTSTTGNQFNVQDATGGVLILDTPLSLGIQQGDSVRVVGRTQVSGGEFVIRNPSITPLGTGTVPAPRLVTPAQVAASTATDPLQGLLVSVQRVRVTAVSGSASSTAYNVTVQDDGGSEFVVRVGSAAVGIPQTYWQIGSYYDVTGLLGNFNGAQVKVRSAADVAQASSATPIAQARQLASGTLVTVEGVATVSVGVFSTSTTGNQFNVQDATGGILVLQIPLASGVQQGDSVRVTGTVAISAAELLLTSSPTVTILASGRNVPAPRLITAAQVAASTSAEPLQGSLVHVRSVRVDSLGSGTSAYNVFVSGEDGSRFIVRVSSGVARTVWEIGSLYNVTGTLAAFNAPQIKVRGAGDVTAATGAVPIGVARQLPTGSVVTVEGVATVSVGIFSTSATGNQFNVQDPTGGILVLQVPLASGIQQGDSVRVTGTTAVSSGEFLLTTSPSVTRLAGGATLPAPLTLAASHVAGSTATDPMQGSLVRVQNVRVDSLGSGTTAYNVFVTGADESRFIVRVSAGTAIARDFWQIGSAHNVTGTLGNFNGAQVKLRAPGDVTAASSGNVTSAPDHVPPIKPVARRDDEPRLTGAGSDERDNAL